MVAKQQIDREEWFAQYEQLSETEQLLLQLVSVWYEPVRLVAIAKSLELSAVRLGLSLEVGAEETISKLYRHGFFRKQQGQYYCPPACREELTLRAVLAGHLEDLVESINNTTLQIRRYSYGMLAYEERLRRWRIAVYLRDWDTAYAQLTTMQRHFARAFAERHPYRLLFRHLYDMDWFLAQPAHFLEAGLKDALFAALVSFEPVHDILEWLELYFEHRSDDASFSVQWALAFHWIIRGYLEEARLLLDGQEDPVAMGLLGCLELLQGRVEESRACLQSALDVLGQDRRRKFVHLQGLAQWFQILLWLKDGDGESLRRAKVWANNAIGDQHEWLQPLYPAVLTLLNVLQGHEAALDDAVSSIVKAETDNSVVEWLRWQIGFWLSPEHVQKEDYQNKLMSLLHRAYTGGYRWIAAEIAELLFQLDSSSQAQETLANKLREETGVVSLVLWLESKPAWALSLQALAKLGQGEETKQSAQESDDTRIVWFLSQQEDPPSVEVKVQKWSVKGAWTRGRSVNSHRLLRDPEYAGVLSAQDRRVAHALSKWDQLSPSYVAKTRREEWKLRTLRELVGHPMVFWKHEPSIRINIIRREPVLRILEEERELRLCLLPLLEQGQWLSARVLSPTTVCVYEANEQHQKLQEILSSQGLSVPLREKQAVLDVVGSVAPLVTIHSDIGGNSKDVENVEPDSRLFLDLFPYNTGLRAELRVMPLSEEGPRLLPGEGPAAVFAQVGERSLHARRDKVEESERMEDLLETVESLGFRKSKNGEWLFDSPEEALELLLELQSVPSEMLVVRWPEGQTLKLRASLDHQQMEWKIQGSQDWFSATGSLKVDDELVLETKTLLRLLELSEGKFLALEDGEFVALTDEFRARLESFRAFSDHDGSFPASAAFAMESLLEGAGDVEVDRKWKKHLKRLHAKPKALAVPKGLQATLRDYQEEGFRWLSQLAHWQFGACLADEMGLGKTLQAIAVLLARAEEGPALVVAPTSVCPNWESEIQKFAPGLRSHLLATSDREEVLSSLAPGEVLIASYGLLQNEAEKINEVHWSSIILDEAQAIKNRATKRSQVAMTLRSDFRMITTGTPIENHLGELWNLYRFINPGLLGSWEHFQEHFARPIERGGDGAEAVRERLRVLIQPFLLRRRKADVLDELPPRTESVLHVEMSPEETALYEALRQKALQSLLEPSAVSGGQQHLQILAELMKLRRACCHPKLVLEDSTIPSSKLALLDELLEELLENEHKVLVFSQFVGHLTLIRERLDEKEIHYQYLDGSTPLRQRKQRINAFQQGEGDVFLISLKAGGFGINLTAADYVIHMDPWWNPAVEDQASDRAHRIGQTRPVTVYRLVTQHTIEEKILALHEQKRDLAESLLEGSDMTGKMSADELLSLIQTS
ncbi:MAG: DEAD/DEAH box helicase [Deltaproteobacteria bacterium]|nr:MAG: DEAD/DEAH box helicase [Deltaproteobacteria bacterium]